MIPMPHEVLGPELEKSVALFLEVTEPYWACRECIADTQGLSIRQVKIALLRLARVRGKRYIETGCDTCAGCGMETAVVRLDRRGRLRLIA